MKRFLSLLLLASLSLAVPLSSARAAFSPSGDVSPTDDPSTWTSSTNAYIGNTSAGSLTVDGGSALLSYDSYIGNNSGATGVVQITGANSTWTDSDYIYVGYSGTGTMNIANSGAVNGVKCYIGYNSGSSGTLTVDGAGTTLTNVTSGAISGNVYVGYYGSGTLKITNGGTVSDVNGESGFYAGPTSTTTVDGAGSLWKNSNYVFAGTYGSGMINVTNGGTLSADIGFTDYAGGSNGTVTIDGSGSTWTSRWLQIGYSGNGTMKITNGGAAVSSYMSVLAQNTGSTANVTIDGANSTWTTYNLYVGYDGIGAVTQTGGYVSASGTIFFAFDSGGTGTYNLNGGTLANASITIGAGTTAFNFGGGTFLATGAFSTGLPMNLTGIGGNAGVDTAGNAVTLSGALSGVGGITKLGAGTLTLTGANGYAGTTTVKAGILELGTAAETPVLSGAGADVQGGQLVLDYISGSDIASTVVNLLQSHVITSSNLGGYHQLGWIDDTVNDKVTVVYTVGGDANLDGVTDGADLGAVLANFGKTGMSWSNGDFNYDGTVNGADLGVVLANFGQHSSITAAVPEPGTLALLVAGAFGLLAYARRQRRRSKV